MRSLLNSPCIAPIQKQSSFLTNVINRNQLKLLLKLVKSNLPKQFVNKINDILSLSYNSHRRTQYTLNQFKIWIQTNCLLIYYEELLQCNYVLRCQRILTDLEVAPLYSVCDPIAWITIISRTLNQKPCGKKAYDLLLFKKSAYSPIRELSLELFKNNVKLANPST